METPAIDTAARGQIALAALGAIGGSFVAYHAVAAARSGDLLYVEPAGDHKETVGESAGNFAAALAGFSLLGLGLKELGDKYGYEKLFAGAAGVSLVLAILVGRR